MRCRLNAQEVFTENCFDMTKKEFLEMPAFKNAKDDAAIWITHPNSDDCWPIDSWILRFADGNENLIIRTKLPPEDLSEIRWLGWRKAAKKLNEANCGIFFFGNLFTYLRNKGELKGLCRKVGRKWEYDTDGIIEKAHAHGFNYKGK